MAATLLGPSAASAAQSTAGSAPGSGGLTPVAPGLRIAGRHETPKAVIAAARRVPRIAAVLRAHPGAHAQAYLRDRHRWQVSWFVGGGRHQREIAQVIVSDRTGRVLEAWTGIQVRWTMARGYPGAFGRQAGALYVWLVLLGLFLLPFLRPPWRLLHLDLLVLASFSVSLAFFSHGTIDASVPLAYPPLVYLLVRLLLLARGRGRARRAPPAPLRLLVGHDFLLIAIMFLLGFRIALQLFASNVIDVGYAGVIGADHITHGTALYGHFPPDNPRGDTYGPLTYLAYVPFELIWPWHGTWDDLPSAHAAAAVFDLLCGGLLYGVGRRLRGSLHGLLLLYLWLTFPFTLFAANSGANDALVGALVLAAVALSGRPALRGATAAAAALTKLAPFALLPLLARSRRAALGAAVVLALSLGLVAVLDGGLGELWQRTVGFQSDRSSPFSVWGLYHLELPQRLVQLAGGGLALAVAFSRRREDPIVLAALSAAVLIAVQLGATHWFYLYIMWFAPLVFVALLGGYEPSYGRRTGSIASARPGTEQRTSTALIHGSSSAGP